MSNISCTVHPAYNDLIIWKKHYLKLFIAWLKIIQIQNINNKLFCFVLYTVVEIADNGNQTKIQELSLKITLC